MRSTQNKIFGSSSKGSRSRLAIFALVIAVSSSGISTSWGSTISKAQAGRAFKNIQATITSNLKTLEVAKTERTINQGKVQTDAIQALDSLKKAYEQSKIKNSEDLISLKTKLNSVARVKVLVNNISGICPSHSGNCYLNEVVDVPSTFDLTFFLKLGAVELLNANEYNTTVASIEKNRKDLEAIENDYINQGKALQEKFALQNSQVVTQYYSSVEPIEENIALHRSALISAKRAEKAKSDFLGAFTTSYTFEFNAKSVYEVANSPLSSITSLLGARAVLDAVEWNGKAESIKSAYSEAKAKAFNKVFGNTFISDAEFKQNLRLVQELYKKAAR